MNKRLVAVLVLGIVLVLLVLGVVLWPEKLENYSIIGKWVGNHSISFSFEFFEDGKLNVSEVVNGEIGVAFGTWKVVKTESNAIVVERRLEGKIPDMLKLVFVNNDEVRLEKGRAFINLYRE